jgi:hypothetical protein
VPKDMDSSLPNLVRPASPSVAVAGSPHSALRFARRRDARRAAFENVAR